MKKTSKPNPLKTFNNNNAMAYKKAGGAMKAFKKSLTKAQNGISVNSGMESMAKPGKSMYSSYNTNTDILNAELAKKAIGSLKRPYMSSDSRGTQLESYGISPGIPKAMAPNYMEEVVKKYGTSRGGMTPEDIEKLKAAGLYKKGGSVKRKK
jgi:general stress protein YciG